MTDVQIFIDKIKNSQNMAVLTGAGVSAASGIPTFRGQAGLWKKYRPEELANPQAFRSHPDIVWEWYAWRRDLIRQVKPNLAHYALVEIEKKIPAFTLITQNVDNLHQLSGSINVVELHGNIMKSKCIDCNHPTSDNLNLKAGLPYCRSCGGLIRPDVVWYGEYLPMDALKKAQTAAMECDLFLSLGTSALVEPAASLPYLAKANGAFLVEINMEETPLSSQTDIFLIGQAEKIISEITHYL